MKTSRPNADIIAFSGALDAGMFGLFPGFPGVPKGLQEKSPPKKRRTSINVVNLRKVRMQRRNGLR